MVDSAGYGDRREAGRRLSHTVREALPDPGDAVVLALPRGGLPVAHEVARALELPLDILIVRKLGLPIQPELAMGAIASGGGRILNQDVISMSRVDHATIDAVEARERAELERRERVYRGEREFPSLRGRTVILVDDGVATGSTLQAAIRTVRSREPARVVAAIPVGPPDVVRDLEEAADVVVCPLQPKAFFAIGAWYEDFGQMSDDGVREVLAQAWEDSDR